MWWQNQISILNMSPTTTAEERDPFWGPGGMPTHLLQRKGWTFCWYCSKAICCWKCWCCFRWLWWCCSWCYCWYWCCCWCWCWCWCWCCCCAWIVAVLVLLSEKGTTRDAIPYKKSRCSYSITILLFWNQILQCDHLWPCQKFWLINDK